MNEAARVSFAVRQNELGACAYFLMHDCKLIMTTKHSIVSYAIHAHGLHEDKRMCNVPGNVFVIAPQAGNSLTNSTHFNKICTHPYHEFIKDPYALARPAMIQTLLCEIIHVATSTKSKFFVYPPGSMMANVYLDFTNHNKGEFQKGIVQLPVDSTYVKNLLSNYYSSSYCANPNDIAMAAEKPSNYTTLSELFKEYIKADNVVYILYLFTCRTDDLCTQATRRQIYINSSYASPLITINEDGTVTNFTGTLGQCIDEHVIGDPDGGGWVGGASGKRLYTVRLDKDKRKYITYKKKRVHLSEIRGKYRYSDGGSKLWLCGSRST